MGVLHRVVFIDGIKYTIQMPLVLHTQIQISTNLCEFFRFKSFLLELLRPYNFIGTRASIEATFNGFRKFKVLQGGLKQTLMRDALDQVQLKRFRRQKPGPYQLYKGVHQLYLLLRKKKNQIAEQTNMFDSIGSRVGIDPPARCKRSVQQGLGKIFD